MIISRTPFRVSFFGGGTDLPAFYEEEPGAVVSSAINYHMFITVHRLSSLHPHRIRLSYSRTELVNSPEELQHPVVRAVLQWLDIREPIEITSIADIPARTGLGSSSSFTVGLLHALHVFRGEAVSAEQLAQEACHIEINLLGEPIGRQDQYAAAYGGVNYFRFMPDHVVHVQQVPCSRETLCKLERHLMMFYVGGTRSASDILSEQSKETPNKRHYLRQMRDLCPEALRILSSGRDLVRFGELAFDNCYAVSSKNDDIFPLHLFPKNCRFFRHFLF